MITTGSRLLPSGAVAAAQNAPLYGTVIVNLAEETPAAVVAAIAGDTSMGLPFGFLTDLPTFNVSRETVNITEPIAGLGTRLKGSEQLQNEEGTVELAFAQLSIENLQRALPGTTKAAWNSDTTASITVGTGNSSVRVRALTPGTAGNSLQYAQPAAAGSAVVVSVTGTAPNQTITATPGTTSTANDVIDAINSHATAKTLVQAGRPSGTDGTGAPATAVAAALAGGAAGTRIGYQLTSQGSWKLSDYIRTVHIVWESTATNVAMMARIKNAISMDDFSFQGDDGGQMSGVSMTLTATADEADYDANSGNYKGPFAFLRLDPVAVAA